jgi:hypothetical protein
MIYTRDPKRNIIELQNWKNDLYNFTPHHKYAAAHGRKRGGKAEDTQISTQNVSTFHSLNIKI